MDDDDDDATKGDHSVMMELLSDAVAKHVVKQAAVSLLLLALAAPWDDDMFSCGKKRHRVMGPRSDAFGIVARRVGVTVYGAAVPTEEEGVLVCCKSHKITSPESCVVMT